MGQQPTILHADLDAFYASVEQRDNPHLRQRPVIVGTGVVLAASYEAKAYGVRTAMGTTQARRLCPSALVVEPRMSAYSEASRTVFEVFEQTTPLVEALSIDEAFLDVGGLGRVSGPPPDIARRLRREVMEQAGLPISVGLARTKFLAKVASAVAKPDGFLTVPTDGELDFLHPLPVESLWGVGKVTSAKLHDRGIRTVGEVAALPEAAVVSMLGKAAGRHIHALASGLDPRPVQIDRRRKSVGAQHALGRSPRSAEDIDALLVALVDRVAGRLRAGDKAGRTVQLSLRFDDFSRATRAHTMSEATARTERILAVARQLLAGVQPEVVRSGLTLIGIAVGELQDAASVQLSLEFDGHDRNALDTTLDQVRDRYGSDSITRAVLLGRDTGISMPQLPDQL